jgi:hypothetical protein
LQEGHGVFSLSGGSAGEKVRMVFKVLQPHREGHEGRKGILFKDQKLLLWFPSRPLRLSGKAF